MTSKHFDMKSFGKKLIALRKSHQLSATALGVKLGVSYMTVIRWELGKRMPGADMLFALSNILGVSVYHFSGRE